LRNEQEGISIWGKVILHRQREGKSPDVRHRDPSKMDKTLQSWERNVRQDGSETKKGSGT